MVKQTTKNGIGKGTPGPGRPKGSTNTANKLLKEAILQALDEAHPDGAVEYLKAQAALNPGPFLTLIGKVLPLQVSGENGQAIGLAIFKGLNDDR